MGQNGLSGGRFPARRAVPARRIPGGTVPDPALASTALPLLVTGVAALGAALGVVAEILSRRALPHLAGPPRLANRTATALGTGALCALLAWRFGLSMELAAF